MAVWAVNIPTTVTRDSAYWEHFAQRARRIAVDVDLTRSSKLQLDNASIKN